MVVDRYGEEMWKKILSDARMDPEKQYDSKTSYEDKELFQIIRSISLDTDIIVEKVWEMFGEYFFDYAWKNGFDTLLKSMADNLEDFLENLNSIHYYILKVYFDVAVQGPTFQSVLQADGSIKLHYYSHRDGMYPALIGRLPRTNNVNFSALFVTGLLRKAARKIFNIDAKIVTFERSEVRRKNAIIEHVIYNIEPASNDISGFYKQRSARGKKEIPRLSLPISASTFATLFPTHICFNRELVVEHCGSFLKDEFNLSPGQPLVDFMSILQPDDVQMTFEDIETHLNSIFICQMNNDMIRAKTSEKRLSLKGQMHLVDGGNYVLYLNSPEVTSARNCRDLNMYVSDLQYHDATREMIMLKEMCLRQRGVNGKLEEAVCVMKRLTSEMEDYRQRADQLMFERIPAEIANVMRDGQHVEAQEFASATCLVTVICNFDIITMQCQPKEIFAIMNDLFRRYDSLIDRLQCYKVLSIMDSYFIVAGAPKPCDNHAEKIMNLALCLLVETKQVKVPNMNLPLMLKAGIHTGSVVAGVMGTSQIRYGVLGETVNIATRMTSYADRGTILVSHTSKLHASKTSNDSFVFEIRGYLNSAAKSATYAHFLISNKRRSIWEIMECERPLEASIDGYREAHTMDDQVAWDHAEKNMKKVRQIVDAFRGERSEISKAAERLRHLRKTWTSRESNDSGISRGCGSRTDSTVCTIS
uniref:guanylate cyclase n=1 Tax=Steinernema glaseri TaxID=37863 RepID=A0A1I8AKP9_9BILA